MVRVARPHEVACYSKHTDDRVDAANRAQLRQFVRPDLGVSYDLSEGLDTFVPKRQVRPPVSRVVDVVLEQNPGALQRANVVTFRNNLNKIGNTLQDRLNEWKIDCCYIDDKLFLDICITQDESALPDDLKRYIYCGYKFEAVCTGEPRSTVDANAEYCSVAELNVGHHRILLSSEIDCINGRPTESGDILSQYVELKTVRRPHCRRAEVNMYKHKYAKFWLQSFLAGVPTVAIGFRLDNCFLDSTIEIKTEHIFENAHAFLSSANVRPWSPALIINFIDCVLTSAYRCCVDRKGYTVRLSYVASQRQIHAHVIADPDSGVASEVRPLLSKGRRPSGQKNN